MCETDELITGAAISADHHVRVWVDADSCPRAARQYIVKKAALLRFAVTFVANRPIPMVGNREEECNKANAEGLFTMAVCGKEKDAADDVIVAGVLKCDAVVTRDIPLASRLVGMDVCVMNDRGVLFTKYNIEEKLSERDFNLQLAQIGFGGSSASVYGDKELCDFAKCFDREIKRLMLSVAATAKLV